MNGKTTANSRTLTPPIIDSGQNSIPNQNCCQFQAKKKRSLYGTYSPQKHEHNAPRVEHIELKLKIPPEERLI